MASSWGVGREQGKEEGCVAEDLDIFQGGIPLSSPNPFSRLGLGSRGWREGKGGGEEGGGGRGSGNFVLLKRLLLPRMQREAHS